MRNFELRNKASAFTALLLFVLLVGYGYKPLANKNASKPNVIAWDIFGYYLYLPATFIYHDIGLENQSWLDTIQKKYPPSPGIYQVTGGVDNKKAIIYHMGLSIVYAPAFFVAHGYAKLAGYPADGFSAPYQWSIIILGFTYILIGLLLFRKLLLYFFSDRLAAVLLLLIVLGTNYLIQISLNVEMPHNFLFTLNCFIVLFTIKWHERPSLKYAIPLSLLLGTVIVCRPTEIVMVLIPLFWNVKDKVTLTNKVLLFKKYFSHLIIVGLGIVFLLLLQLAYWKYTTGSFLKMNFHAETLTIFRPFTLKFLFSYKKGWLLYTPLMAFAIMGFIALFKNNRAIFYALLLFFIANLWLISSWECWWYATSFGQRPMVESYMIMAIPLGYLIRELKQGNKFIRGFVITCLVFFVALNLFQSWQFNNYVFDSEHMTKKYYWKVFGKTNVEPETRKLLEINRNFPPDGKEVLKPENEADYRQREVFFTSYESESDNAIVSNVVYTGTKSMRLDSINRFSPAINKKYTAITKKDYFWLRTSVYIYPTTSLEKSPLTIVVEYKSNKRTIRWTSAKTDTLKIIPNTWNLIAVDRISPVILQNDDEWTIYCWNIGNDTVYIDDFKIEAFIPKH